MTVLFFVVVYYNNLKYRQTFRDFRDLWTIFLFYEGPRTIAPVAPFNSDPDLNHLQRKFVTTGAEMAQLVWSWATGWTARIGFPTGERYFSLLHSVQTGPGAHPVS
jgi:hypothetical protein